MDGLDARHLIVRDSGMASELTDDIESEARKQVRRHVFPVSADYLNEVGWWDFHQMSRLNPFGFDFHFSVKNYEDGIRDSYLKIARRAGTAAASGEKKF